MLHHRWTLGETHDVMRPSVSVICHLKKLSLYPPPETRRDKGAIFSIIMFQGNGPQIFGENTSLPVKLGRG